MKLAVLFSGQGAQYANMGLDWAAASKEIDLSFSAYSQLIDLDFKTLLSDETKINDTRYTQPLMVAVEMVIHDYLVNQLKLKVDGYAGFSLGEYAAFYAAGYYHTGTILKLIDERAKLMQEASIKFPGSMAAILSLDDQDVESICRSVSDESGCVVAANYNSPGQLVISGERSRVEKAVELAKAKGARRAIMLNVSGAFHSPYMSDAGIKLRAFAGSFIPHKTNAVVYANSNAKPLDVNDLLDEIEKQIQSPVYFKQTIERMIKDGFTHFLEVGPGSVLTGLVKKINPDVVAYSVSKYQDLDHIKEIIDVFKR